MLNSNMNSDGRGSIGSIPSSNLVSTGVSCHISGPQDSYKFMGISSSGQVSTSVLEQPDTSVGSLQISKWLSQVSSYLAGASLLLPPAINNNELFCEANSQVHFCKKDTFLL